MADFYGSGQQALWNFDGAESIAIFELKARFILQMSDWELEQAYWTARTIRMELDAMLTRTKKKDIVLEIDTTEKVQEKESKTEKAIIDSMLKDVEEYRCSYLENKYDDEIKTRFFQILENFYMNLCLMMKKHGMYFREGEDSTFAVLRR